MTHSTQRITTALQAIRATLEQIPAIPAKQAVSRINHQASIISGYDLYAGEKARDISLIIPDLYTGAPLALAKIKDLCGRIERRARSAGHED